MARAAWLTIFCTVWAQYVGIGTAIPLEAVHVAGGDVRVQGLSGTGTALVGLTSQGVTYRLDFSGNAADFLRGDGTWGPDIGDWKLPGNAGTNPTLHFLGSTDAQQLRLRTNNTERARFQVDGRILVGTTTPLYNKAVLQVQGGTTNRAVYGYKASSSGASVVLGIATRGGGPYAGAVGYGAQASPSGTTVRGVGLVGMVGVLDFIHWALGPGIVGTGQNYGIVAYAENTTGDRAAGRFEAPAGAGQIVRSLVSAFVGGTQYKIWGTVTGGGGTPATSTVVEAPSGQLYAMACPEAPEIFFFDRGQAELVGGEAYIALDSVLAFNLYVDAAYPLYVFLQPLDRSCGLYVTERSRLGFRVRATDSTCQTRFYWWAVARRNDTYTPEGLRISRHVGVRLPEVPEELTR
ncbi:MAG: hypothetical protein KatS3mg026_1221 [Bacteroidia bacterium]|nr:MAG: hypothetical protein KatS3mg026_1221 [Bacteroidia bacterium]